MELLKKCYIGWQFDTKDEVQVKVWYSSFKNLTDEQFKTWTEAQQNMRRGGFGGPGGPGGPGGGRPRQ